MKVRLFYYTIFLITFFLSCTQPECEVQNESLVNISFVKANNLTNTDVSYALSDFKVYGVNREDSLLYDVDTSSKRTTISIPLSLAADSCKYVFLNGGIYDTLSFFYERQTQLISVECGFHSEFIIINALGTEHSFSKFELKDGKISANNEENFRLHFDK